MPSSSDASLRTLLFWVSSVSVVFYSAPFELTIAASTPPSANVTVSALLAVKAAISSDPLGVLSSWNPSAHFCTWQGVVCSSEPAQHVKGLTLQSNLLQGTLSPRLVDLQGLAYLNVSNNSFSGPIPPQVGDLSGSLTHLDLSVNGFKGSIPSSLSRCTLLQYLDLNNNSLTSRFPSYVINFTQLGYLDLSTNSITGQLPADIGLLSQLQFFQMYSTLLTGSIPPSLMNCSKLVWLDFAGTLLAGPLPSDWTKLGSSLQELKLMDANFSGAIPSSLGNCSFLTLLSLQNNSFTGNIPDSFGHLSRLQDIRLYYNDLSGPIPPSLMNCTALNSLQLSYNNLSGSIPNDIGRLAQVSWISFSGNPFIEGPIPDSIGGCLQLEVLSLFQSSLGGSLPASLFNITSLQRLSLQECRFSGRLPRLVGRLTSLSEYLDLSFNAFEGPIPSELGQLKSLQGLFLHENQFSGSIPEQLSGLLSISEMNLSSNPISGSIPSSFAELTSLNQLSIRNTQLSGPIPNIFAKLNRLEVVDLAHNMFTGLIPDSLATLNTLSISLDLSFNNFSGAIPSSFGGMGTLQSMNLSHNSFSGEIPSRFGSCRGMQVLDLSNNRLNGEIPDALGQMISLQYLDLSQNHLSGTLPASIGLLDSLASFNVSFNELKGTVPSTGVYGNSSRFSYVGNAGLCGDDPSSAACNEGHGKSHRKQLAIVLSACIAGGAVLAAVLFACFWWWCCKRGKKNDEPIEGDMHEAFTDGEESFDAEMPRFKAWTAKELRAATNDFGEENVLGSGAVSVCYKGFMTEDVKEAKKRLVAVKRLNVEGGHRLEARRSFVNELRTICKVRHRNVVKVLGYCVEGGEVALVMEYMKEGDLDGHLHGKEANFGWLERLNVAVNVAEGLVYLHHEYIQPIVHCDLKPKNILLGDDGTAKISDFGIAKLLDLDEASDMSISKFRGTFGYASPEYAAGARISTRADVYSYGVLLLELLTGRRPTSPELQEEGTSLHAWARSRQASKRTREVVADAVLADGAATEEEAQELLALGVKCSSEAVKDRPPTMKTVRDVVVRIQARTLARTTGTLPPAAFPPLDELLRDRSSPLSMADATKLLLDPSIQIDSFGLHSPSATVSNTSSSLL